MWETRTGQWGKMSAKEGVWAGLCDMCINFEDGIAYCEAASCDA